MSVASELSMFTGMLINDGPKGGDIEESTAFSIALLTSLGSLTSHANLVNGFIIDTLSTHWCALLNVVS